MTKAVVAMPFEGGDSKKRNEIINNNDVIWKTESASFFMVKGRKQQKTACYRFICESLSADSIEQSTNRHVDGAKWSQEAGKMKGLSNDAKLSTSRTKLKNESHYKSGFHCQ